ncbi:MAG: hypothetical protein E7677_06685 [Ruminococcaceae bacterium]|nr:hypothetical protein [Oscillospiraceae bacterium]
MTVKKSISLILTLILTVTAVCPCFFVTAVATAPSSYTDISADSSAQVTITSMGEQIYFRFVPTHSGTYAFYSSDYTTDPYGFLYDTSGAILANENDISELNNFNFRIEYKCQANAVYYIGACSGSMNDSYKLNVETVSIDPIPKISIGSASDLVGEYVTVDISISENKGVLGALLTLNYNEKLTLVKAEAGSAWSKLNLTKPSEYKNSCSFVWDGLYESDSENGTVLTLTFLISNEANAGDSYDISAECDAYDGSLQKLEFEINGGKVTVLAGKRGDIDNDKEITVRDVILLRRYIEGANNESIDETVADVNSDGNVDSTDLTMLRQYLAGGYGVEI